MYKSLLESYQALVDNESYEISLLSNTSAFIYEQVKDLNWSGFYLHKDNKLILGPFQGKVACNVIEPNKGVCGTSLVKKETIVVPDVSKHDNHIYCDKNSKSEVVIPIIVNDSVYGVFDFDSPIVNRFDEELVEFLESVVNILETKIMSIIK